MIPLAVLLESQSIIVVCVAADAVGSFESVVRLI
jgi:hypothetical protein